MAEYLKLFRKAVDYEEYEETCTPPKPVNPTDYPVLGLPGHVITYEATSKWCPNYESGDYPSLAACDFKDGKGMILCKQTMTRDDWMFQGTNATVVRFPSTVTSLTPTAFWNTRVKNVYFESTTPVTTYDYDPFYNSSIEKIYVPENSVDAYKAAWANNEYISMYVDIIFPYDPYYKERWVQIENICDGYNLYEQEKKQVTHDGGVTWEDNGETRRGALIMGMSTECGYVTMSNTISYVGTSKLSETTSNKTSGVHTNAFNTTIAAHTFDTDLGRITFDNTVTSLGAYAFYGCNFKNIEIPETVTSFGNYAFYSCNNLVSITIKAATPPALGTDVFTNSCQIYVPSGSVNTYKSASGWSTYASRIRPITN